MRVLFLIPHPHLAASSRLRVYQYLPWLRQAGIAYEVRPFMSERLYRILYEPGRHVEKIARCASAIARRVLDVARSSRADVVVVHREAWPLGSAVLERAVRRLGAPLVFDFDDAVYLENASHANSWTRMLRRAGKTARIIDASDAVIAGNAQLADYVRRWHPRVAVIPTPVDTERFVPGGRATSADRLVIGWIGSHTTAAYLAGLRGPLEALRRRYPQLVVRVVGAGRSPLDGDLIESVPWKLEDEVRELQGFDIGVMPMPDDEWTRGKCGFKALLYMSVGIPVVASPVGVNRRIVRDGVNGFLASTEEEWEHALGLLIEDASLRARMGRAGRQIVEEDFSVERQAARFIEVLEAAAARREIAPAAAVELSAS